MKLPLMFIFCLSFNCIFSNDMGVDMSPTIIWACFSFFQTKFVSQGFDSITTLPNFWMLAVIIFSPVSILYASLVWLRLSLFSSECKHMSLIATHFSRNVCRSDAEFSMLNTFLWYSSGSFCFSSKDTCSSRVSSVTWFFAYMNWGQQSTIILISYKMIWWRNWQKQKIK
jgi:hypothetical protein